MVRFVGLYNIYNNVHRKPNNNYRDEDIKFVYVRALSTYMPSWLQLLF